MASTEIKKRTPPKNYRLIDITTIANAIPISPKADVVTYRIFGKRMLRMEVAAKLFQIALEAIAANRAKVMNGNTHTIVELMAQRPMLARVMTADVNSLLYNVAKLINKTSDYYNLVGHDFYYSKKPPVLKGVDQKLFGYRLCVIYDVRANDGS